MIIGLDSEHNLWVGCEEKTFACGNRSAGLAIISRYLPRMGTE
jgi:hypothetical protein